MLQPLEIYGRYMANICYDKSHINLLYPVDAIINCGQHGSVLIYSRSGTAVWWHQAIVGIGVELLSIGSERTHLSEFRSLAVLRICIVNCVLKSCFKNDIRVYKNYLVERWVRCYIKYPNKTVHATLMWFAFSFKIFIPCFKTGNQILQSK